ncbi:hypothetical protein GCM10018952_51960 [Streptosporangium vulgare]
MLLKRLLGHPVDEEDTPEASQEELAEGAQAATGDLTRPERPARPTRRRSATVAAIAAGIAILGVAGALVAVELGLARGGRAEPTRPPVAQPSTAPSTSSPSTPPTPKVSTGSPLLDRVRDTGRLRVGFRKGLPGISLGEDPPRGFEADVAAHLATALGVPERGLRFVPVGLGGRERAVEKGRADLVIANFSIDGADPGRVAFAGPYYVAHRDGARPRQREDRHAEGPARQEDLPVARPDHGHDDPREGRRLPGRTGAGPRGVRVPGG